MDLLSINQKMFSDSLDDTESANAIAEISSFECDKNLFGHELLFANDSIKFDPNFLDTQCDSPEVHIKYNTIDGKPVKIWQCKICK